MIPVLAELLLNGLSLLLGDVADLLAGLAIVGPLEDARRVLSELEVDDVGSCGRGDDLLIEADYFELGASRHQLGFHVFGVLAATDGLAGFNVNGKASQLRLFHLIE